MSDQKQTPEELDLGTFDSTVEPANFHIYANEHGLFITAVPAEFGHGSDQYYGTQLTWEQAQQLGIQLTEAVSTYDQGDQS